MSPPCPVDIIRRPRSTGSILKPLLYAAMLEDGSLTPRMLLPDVPTHYEGFPPENFDRQYRGAVRADEALAHSLNIPAVRMLKTYGIARFADLLRGAGMSTLTRPADDYGLTLILGGAEGNLWDISAMYASLADIARAGAADAAPRFRELTVCATRKRQAPRPLAHRHRRGLAHARRLVRSAAPRRRRPLEAASPPAAASPGKPARAGDCATAGPWATPARYTVGVWVGNASGEGRPGLTGSTMAAPLMFAPVQHPAARATGSSIPMHALERIDTCANDGFLATGDCEPERTWMPRDSHFDALSPHNLRVHLEPSRQSSRGRRLRIAVGA